MSEPGSRRFRRRALWILFAAGVLMALPALRGDILNYDDRNLLLGPEGAFERSPASFFDSTYYYAYLPFYGLGYWVDGEVGGDSPVLLHVANALWHVATGFLVFLVLEILLGSRVAALLGALIFVVHPLHVESVAWISGRKEVMSGFFFFLAWLLHLKNRDAWAASVFLVACFTKATAVVLPALMLAAALILPLYEGRRRQAARATVPFFAAAVLPVAVHLLVGGQAGVVRAPDDLFLRALSGVAAFGRTIGHTLYPFGLSIDYPEARVESAVAALPWALLLAAALVAAWLARRRAPVLCFGIVAYLLALAPHNNVFPATDVYLADRYAYFALFGAAAVVAWAVERWRDAAVVAAVAAAILVALSGVSSSRFRSDEELWTRTIEARDASAVAWFQRGAARTERYKAKTPPDTALRDLAIADFEAALARARLPEHKAKASAGLVIPLVEAGRTKEALERANDALALVEDSEGAEAWRFEAQVLYHRGIVRKAQGEHAMAAIDFGASGALVASYEAFFEEGRSWLYAGHPKQAADALRRAADIRRGSEAPWLYLANAARMTGDMTAYKRALEEAGRRAPRSEEVAEGWVKYWLYGTTPDFRKAGEAVRELPESSPRRGRLEAQVEAQRALFHFRRGRMREALVACDRARALGLDDPSLQYDLGQIYIETGRYDDAVRCFQISGDVLAKRPVHREAVARAYALKANALLRAEARGPARDAMRAALDVRPVLIEAGAAPLRGEIDLLRGTESDDLLLLAAAAVAGDSETGRETASALLKRELPEHDRTLVYWLRGLLRAFGGAYDFEGAERDFKRVLERSPDDPWALYRMAQVWIRGGAAWLRTADELGSDERREQALATIHRAIDLLTDLLEKDPDFHYARLLRGRAHFALGELVEAKADYVRVRESDAYIKEVYVQEAVLHRLSYVKGGSIETLGSAQDLLEHALRIDPNYFDALYELGNVFHLRYDRPGGGLMLRKEAFLNAVLWYRRAMALNKHVHGPRLEWARLLLKAGQEALAAGEIERAHQLIERLEAEASDIAEVHKQRVRLNLLPDFGRRTRTRPEKYFAAAEAALDKVAELAPADPELPALRAQYHRSLGESYFLTWGKLMTAAKMARRGENADEERAKLLAAKAERARELAAEQWRLALEAWSEDPENAGIRDRLRTLDPSFIEEDSRRAKQAFERGKKAYAQGRYAEAAAAFGEAARLFPEWLDIRYYYAMSLARAGVVKRAIEELERVANHEEGHRFPDVLMELGNLYRVKRQNPVARIWYERYLKEMAAAGRAEEPEVEKVERILEELK